MKGSGAAGCDTAGAAPWWAAGLATALEATSTRAAGSMTGGEHGTEEGGLAVGTLWRQQLLSTGWLVRQQPAEERPALRHAARAALRCQGLRCQGLLMFFAGTAQAR